jgi:RNA polymerase sigma-70 factor (ECF subfamily)
VLAKPELSGMTASLVGINGAPGVLFTAMGQPVGALTMETADGLIQELRFQVNPDKLGGLGPTG